MTDSVRKHSYSECYTSSEPFRFYFDDFCIEVHVLKARLWVNLVDWKMFARKETTLLSAMSTPNNKQQLVLPGGDLTKCS
jgi:hypothetical protein